MHISNYLSLHQCKDGLNLAKNLNVNVKWGENDPVELKRGYDKINDWEEGCPYCDKKSLTYNY